MTWMISTWQVFVEVVGFLLFLIVLWLLLSLFLDWLIAIRNWLNGSNAVADKRQSCAGFLFFSVLGLGLWVWWEELLIFILRL